MASEKRISIIVAGVFVLILVIFKTYIYLERKSALANAVVVIGEIESFEYTRGATNVNVQYVYNGKVINNAFGTYHLDGLKIKTKVRLRVSKEYPTEYIEYLNVVNQ